MPDEPTTPPQVPNEPPFPVRNAQPIIPQRQSPAVAPNAAPVAEPAAVTWSPAPAASTQSPAIENMPQPGQQTPMITPDATEVSDKVWINKEEYLRLQQAERAATAAGGASVRPAKLYDKFQIITTAVAALSLLVGLLVQSGGGVSSMFIVPSLVILTLVGAFTVNDKIQASKAGGYIKSHKGRNITLMVVALVILASPILLPVGFVILMMIMCAGGGCKGT